MTAIRPNERTMSANDFLMGASHRQGTDRSENRQPSLAEKGHACSHVHDDFDGCYRAVSSRDTRFDGRFVTAVRTTGILLPAELSRTDPAPGERAFFPRAAAASAAGFRACKRCRPDAAPAAATGTPAPTSRARALRGIESGVATPTACPGWARRLAVSERHLHRTLVREIGVGPLALARTRRAQTAACSSSTPSFPLTTVAFSAGFASVRQFNDVMREEFGSHHETRLRRGAVAPATRPGR